MGDLPKEGRLESLRLKDKGKWVTEIAQILVASHGVGAASSTRKLLQEILVVQRKSEVSKDAKGRWTIPKDLETWKSTIDSLQKLKALLFEADGLYAKLIENPLALAIFMETDNVDGLDEAAQYLRVLAEFVVGLPELNGLPGNRPLAEWKYEAAKLAQTFWRNETGKKPTYSASKDSRRKVAANQSSANPTPFIKWFSELMKLIGKVPDREIQTLVRKRKGRGN